MSSDSDARADVIARVCDLIGGGHAEEGISVLHRDYPFAPVVPASRSYGYLESLRVFRQDGYIDRYSGKRLLFPGTLRLLSALLPEAFPYHPNWKASETHFAYWELFPTVDHVLPVTRGGPDEKSNWVTTSMLRNSAKGSWTLEELGWTLQPAGDLARWDGLESWFLGYVANHPEVTTHQGVRSWLATSRRCREERPQDP